MGTLDWGNSDTIVSTDSLWEDPRGTDGWDGVGDAMGEIYFEKFRVLVGYLFHYM